jgi:hypothetical protein
VVVSEVCDEFFKRGVVVQLESVPKGPFSLAILELGGGNRLGKAKEGQSQVDETVLVIFQLVLAVDDLLRQFCLGRTLWTRLVELQADETHGQSSGCRDSRDDLSSNQLGLVSVGNGNAVVGCTQIGSGSDEVNVVVAVIVLLKVDWDQTESGERGGTRERIDDSIQVFVYGSAGYSACLYIS